MRELVVDHFPLVQLANQAVTEVRRRVTVQQRGRRGRKGNREWELRNRLTRSAERMRGEHVDALVDDLSGLPTPISTRILTARNAKGRPPRPARHRSHPPRPRTDLPNRVIKTVARDAYGFRNPNNQRLRTRCATTRNARGHLNAR
ncbi:hypothetical protein [Plantactinospora sp. KLBMP9567]|uniref:hypothetical protein n=1 Tax=Plantactinospora sp. KLBMP9567 TaxID=3085900 RepID=UPI00298172C6|nr:hypothetical protein [Plantactinospora sp. KLBMP9567]MDW5328029.1 hypothetical protein [Plantactinospora sp. KLBMP9567]